MRNRDPALLRLIDETLLRHPVIDKFGRVNVQKGKVVFDTPAVTGAMLHAPSDLARLTLDRLGAEAPHLSRHRGLFGIYDEQLVEQSGRNYLGLLDPQIQHHLEVIWRVQREEERALLLRIRRGEVKVNR